MRKRRGFSLTEIMIVCAIISILASGMSVTYSAFSSRSGDVLVKREQFLIRQALENYVRRYGQYPQDERELIRSGLVILAFDEGDSLERWRDRWVFVRSSGPLGAVVDAKPRNKTRKEW